MSARTLLRAALLASAAAVAAPRTARAQVRASEVGSVSQTVDGTTITIEYSRPVARGRENLFGDVVRWGETWTPGANWATTLEASRDVHLNGHRLPKGKYAVWMVPRRDSAWTVVLHRDARRFHTRRPGRDDEQLRFDVRPEQGAHMETLAWYFPVVGAAGATLRMHWGTTIVPIRVAVEPTRAERLSAGERAAYLGTYEVSSADGAQRWRVEVLEREGHLRARASLPPPPGFDPEFDLIPDREHRFHLGSYRGGSLFDVATESVLDFRVSDGRATGFALHGPRGEVLARGERAN